MELHFHRFVWECNSSEGRRRVLNQHFLAFLATRLALGLSLVVGTVVLTFILTRLAPGDPIQLLTGDAPSPEFVRAVTERYGLDRPWPEQLVLYLSRTLQGDFGTSIYYGRPVSDLILGRLPATALLAFSAMIVSIIAGVSLGVMAARYQGQPTDSGISALALLGYSIPIFWLAQLLVTIFAVRLDWLPTGGISDLRTEHTGIGAAIDVGRHLVLPTISIALFEMGLTARFTRTAMIEAMGNDYVTVATAKGLSERQVLVRHALRNALLTTITILGLEFGSLLAGAVVTETVYAWPGIGRLFYDSIARRDFPLLTGIVIFASTAIVLVNLVTDLVYATIDPRVYR